MRSLSSIKLLSFIFVLAFLFRFYSLGQVPASLNWDEVSNAYNAFSILKTGRDEYGNFLPLYNRSFDDYKPPLYMYLEILPIALMGLNETSARVPSAFFGTMSVFAIYLLTKRLTQNEQTALLSAFFLSISPWSVLFSRVGFEANIGFFFSLLALVLYLYSIPRGADKVGLKNRIIVLLAALCAGLAMYSYHSVRIFLPIILLVTTLIYYKKVYAIGKKSLLLTIIVGALITLPLFVLSPRESLSGRYATTSLKARVQDLEKSVNLISQDGSPNSLISNILHNRRAVILQSTLQKYISHYDINYLFTSGDDNPRHHVRTNGLLFLFMLPIIIYGIYISITLKNKSTYFLISWLVIAPIPAAFGDAYPHAIRSYLMAVPLIVFAVIAVRKLQSIAKLALINLILSTIIVTMTIGSFLHNYLVHYNKEEYGSWQFGYKEAVLSSISLKNNYEKVIIDPAFEQGYIFWLFYSKFDPKTYQVSGNRNNFDKFYFEDTNSDNDNYLYVMPASSSTDTFNIVETVYNPGGTKTFVLGTK